MDGVSIQRGQPPARRGSRAEHIEPPGRRLSRQHRGLVTHAPCTGGPYVPETSGPLTYASSVSSHTEVATGSVLTLQVRKWSPREVG